MLSKAPLFITTVLVLSMLLACEKPKDDSAALTFNYNLSTVYQTDSVVELAFRFATQKFHPTKNNGQFLVNLREAIVSIIPLENSSVNFVSLLLEGFDSTKIDPIISAQILNSEPRGVQIRCLESGDSLILHYNFRIKRNKPYLFYHSFIHNICYPIGSSTLGNTTVAINENISNKNTASEFSQLSTLLDVSFPLLMSREISNDCSSITTSYEFYRDRPVKLLYYPL